MVKNPFVEVSLDVSAVPAKPVGAGRYTYELARRLSLREDTRPTLIARKDDEMRWEDLRGDARVSAAAPNSRPLRLIWEQARMPSLLASIAPHVHHGPHYTLPRRSRIPKVVTIHDMTFFDHPEWHEKSKVAFFRKSISASVKCAQEIIAVSGDTARRVQERFGTVDLTVIPHGVDHDRFRPIRSEDERRSEQALLQKSGISGRYIAFLGTIEPRKDVPTLIKAFDALAHQVTDVNLVIAGRPGWGIAEVEAAILRSPNSARIVRPGFLPDEAIPALLRNAAVVAYPSLTEGFGLPALEALACGSALVSTRGSAIEEVVDDAALLIQPGDLEALTAAINELLNDCEEAARLSKRGIEVASKFTWEASAARHVDVYRRAAMRS